MPVTTSTGPRLYFLDWLRIAAFGVLVLYHVGLYYVRWDFPVESPFAGRGLEPWMKLSEPWRLSLLFIVSGAATSRMLATGVDLRRVAKRSRRLLLPLLCGVVLVVPPQSYFEVVQRYGYRGSFLDFLPLYFGHGEGFCSGGKCLVLPTWNHLWFLPYLWCYTMVLFAWVALAPKTFARAAGLARDALGGAALLWLPVALLLALRIALHARYPSTHALWGDWFNHAVYLSMFLAGAAFAAAASMWDRFVAFRWAALGLAIASWWILAFGGLGGAAQDTATAVNQWSALVAAFGFARLHVDVDGAWRARLSEAVFPVYILHQTIIVVGSQLLLPVRLRPAVEGPLLVFVTFGVSYAGYLVLRRVPLLRPWFGMERTPPAAVPAGHAVEAAS